MSDSSVKAKFDFIKSPAFRVIHADGMFGGPTPRGNLFISFYSERFPIPTSTVHEVKASGELGEEIRSERTGRTGVLREVEVGVECDLEVAKAFSTWLQQKIGEIEKLQAAHQEVAKEKVL
jgi:hypothetical protein